MQFNAPLRYPGGKARLTQYVSEIIKRNGLVGGQYIEPYAGGAAIAITLLYLEYVGGIHINDLNKQVYSFWKSVLEHTDELCELIRNTPVTLEERLKQKKIHRDVSASPLELGFSTFFLNRTNRSGILNAGVIGGNSQDGEWKIDARFKKEDLIPRIEKIADYKSRINIYNVDAVNFIENTLPNIPLNSLVYLDPPYYHKGNKLYQNHYKRADHEKISNMVGIIPQKWIMSYDNVPEIADLYTDFETETFALSWSARTRYEGSEVMIFGPEVARPERIDTWRGIAA